MNTVGHILELSKTCAASPICVIEHIHDSYHTFMLYRTFVFHSLCVRYGIYICDIASLFRSLCIYMVRVYARYMSYIHIHVCFTAPLCVTLCS